MQAHNRASKRIRYAGVFCLLALAALSACGGGGGGGGNPTQNRDPADFQNAWVGFDSQERLYSLLLNTTGVSADRMTGSFEQSSTLSITDYSVDPNGVGTTENLQGTFSGQTFTMALAATVVPPFLASYQGSFDDADTIRITGGGTSVVLYRSGFFKPGIAGNWSGTDGGQPWFVQIRLRPSFDDSDDAVLIEGTEIRNDRTARIRGHAAIDNVEMVVERATGDARLNGVFAVLGTAIDRNAINIGTGRLTRGGTPGARSVLFTSSPLLNEPHDRIVAVDFRGEGKTDLVTVAPGVALYNVVLSPDSGSLAYVSADASSNTLVIRDLATAQQVAVPAPNNHYIMDVTWSPDSRALTYSVTPNTSAISDLYLLRRDTGTSTRVATAVQPLAYLWSPASGGSPQLAFTASRGTIPTVELLLAAIDGTIRALSGTLVSGGNVREFTWAPDGTRIAFASDSDVNQTFELSVVDVATGTIIDIGPQIAVTTPPAGNEWLGIYNIRWSPDGSYLGYFARPANQEVWVTHTTGSPSRQVTTFATVGQPGQLRWSPDSTRIALTAMRNGASVGDLYVATSVGMANPVRVSDVTAGAETYQPFLWTHDSSAIFYATPPVPFTSPSTIARVRADGTARTTLSSTDGCNFYYDLAMSPAGQYVAFTAKDPNELTCDIFVANADGTNLRRVSDSKEPGLTHKFKWVSGSARLLFTTDEDDFNHQIPELFVFDASGSGIIKLSDAPGTSATIVHDIFVR